VNKKHLTECAQFLTPELREHFELLGRTIVEFDVVHHRYSTPEKHKAALCWLSEQNRGLFGPEVSYAAT
jgi:hypothetical protein